MVYKKNGIETNSLDGIEFEQYSLDASIDSKVSSDFITKRRHSTSDSSAASSAVMIGEMEREPISSTDESESTGSMKEREPISSTDEPVSTRSMNQLEPTGSMNVPESKGSTEEPESTGWMKRISSVYPPLVGMLIHNGTKKIQKVYLQLAGKMTNLLKKEQPVKNEQDDSEMLTQNRWKAAIPKKEAALLLAVLVVSLLIGMYFHYQTTRAQADLKSMIKQLVENPKSSTTLTFTDFRKLLDSDDRRILSEPFRCNGLTWRLLLLKPAGNGGDLGVHLCHDITAFLGDNFSDWSADVKFRLKLVNRFSEREYVAEETSVLFEKNSPYHHCYGWPDFVSINLFDTVSHETAINFEVEITSLKVNLIH